MGFFKKRNFISLMLLIGLVVLAVVAIVVMHRPVTCDSTDLPGTC
jgi:hypothetical protein